MRVIILVFFFVFTPLIILAQNSNYAVSAIPDSLKMNANAVIRLDQRQIDIPSQKLMTIKTIKATTVLNELGLKNLNLGEYYDKNEKINKIIATVYDASGNELKVYKRKDFKDSSVADGISIFTDNRMLYLDYTPTTYPFTIVFETETETSNTAFISPWSPVDSYLVSTENSSLYITYKSDLSFRKKEERFSKSYPINKQETLNTLTYTARNLIAKKKEELSPPLEDVFPIVYFALDNFQLESVSGKAANWSDLGKWYYKSLLADTEDIPEETQFKIKQLVGVEKNPLEIAKIIYKYVQEKTRYVSIQVGIGGWKPMLAKDVDKLGYGDCKALTNYTRSLLKVVGVPSYFTLVYAGAENTKDFNSDFAFAQGNHAILTIPTDKGHVWLECTSQIHPFGFQGDFTDDRNVLVIKPEGGEIVKTKTFTENETVKSMKASYSISESGDLLGKVTMISRGIEYDNVFQKERMSKENQIKHYKEEFDKINGLKINKITLNNNKDKVEFTEDMELKAEGYAQNSGGKLMFALNAIDQSSYVPKKYRTREFPFQIERGYTHEDEIEISLPEGFSVEAKPEGTELKTDFGTYKIDFTTVSSNKIILHRKLVIKKGFYDKAKYEEYRKFREAIAKNDNSKIIIAKT